MEEPLTLGPRGARPLVFVVLLAGPSSKGQAPYQPVGLVYGVLVGLGAGTVAGKLVARKRIAEPSAPAEGPRDRRLIELQRRARVSGLLTLALARGKAEGSRQICRLPSFLCSHCCGTESTGSQRSHGELPSARRHGQETVLQQGAPGRNPGVSLTPSAQSRPSSTPPTRSRP